MPTAVAHLSVFEFEQDVRRVAMPRPEIHLVVRFGPSARDGLDVHAFGAQQTARRKLIRGGQQSVMARLRLGAHEAVLGVPASAIAGRIVPLEDLWGNGETRRLTERLAAAKSTADAARALERAIEQRSLVASAGRRAPAQLALAAADKLTSESVTAVATDLGVSERHLRRVFRETVGVSPKAFAKLSRFHRALRAAREDAHSSWASIAADSGYYDQAHLIADFRTITGATPQSLRSELGEISY
jgi:AraC-like DNA-binding protein